MGGKVGGGQLALKACGGHGGRREGAGRPPGERPRVRHRTRPKHPKHAPMHVTLRAKANLPSLRSELVQRMLERLLRRERPDFQVLHYSIQRDHLHLIAEADDAKAVASGMNSFASRFAKQLNKLLGARKGKVWDHRYHRRDLGTPTQVKNALAYVLHNWRKHREAPLDAHPRGCDPRSSAGYFNAWMLAESAHEKPPPRAPLDWGSGRGRATEGWGPPAARTWLLRKGWRRLLRGVGA